MASSLLPLSSPSLPLSSRPHRFAVASLPPQQTARRHNNNYTNNPPSSPLSRHVSSSISPTSPTSSSSSSSSSTAAVAATTTSPSVARGAAATATPERLPRRNTGLRAIISRSLSYPTSTQIRTSIGTSTVLSSDTSTSPANSTRQQSPNSAGTSLLPQPRGRPILPPLPAQGPSPLNQSSSPRNYLVRSTSSPTPASLSSPAPAMSTPTRLYASSSTGPPSTPTPARPSHHAPQPPTGSASDSAPGSSFWGTPTTPHDQLNDRYSIPNEWGEDSVIDDGIIDDSYAFATSTASLGHRSSSGLGDDLFLNDLVEAEFSSPSGYPHFTNLGSLPEPLEPPVVIANNSPFGLDEASTLSRNPQRMSGMQASTFNSNSLPANWSPPSPSFRASNSSSYNQRNVGAPSRSDTQLTSTSHGDSQITTQNTTFSNDLFDPDEFIATPSSSFSTASMPASRNRTTRRDSPAAAEPVSANKRRRISGLPNAGQEARPGSRGNTTQNGGAQLDSDDGLFGESPTKLEGGLSKPETDVDTIDLTEATEVPAELQPPPVDKRVKLAAFQCVICMDDASQLTLTHCGHLFCGQCLHSSLNVEATRGKCPMCRQKIDMKSRESYSTKTKGFWPLELKLMTVTRKGKRKADQI